MTRNMVRLRRVRTILAVLLTLFPVLLLYSIALPEVFTGNAADLEHLLVPVYLLIMFFMVGQLSLPWIASTLMLWFGVHYVRDNRWHTPYKTAIHGVASFVSMGVLVRYGRLMTDSLWEEGYVAAGVLLLCLHCAFFLLTLVVYRSLWKNAPPLWSGKVRVLLPALLFAAVLAFNILVWLTERSKIWYFVCVGALVLCALLQVAAMVTRGNWFVKTEDFYRIGENGGMTDGENRETE